MEVLEVIQRITTEAKANPQDLRFIRTMPFDKHVRQGDIYLWRIRSIPKGCTPRENRQLAEGASIGQRHMIGAKAKLYDLPTKMRHPLLGPVIEIPEREVGTHPEHAHYSLPACIVQVGYQLDEKTQRAVRD